MCFSTRKGPACIVGFLSFVTCLLSAGLVYLAMEFNGSGLKEDLSFLAEYITYVFYGILGAAIIGLTCSCCGFLACQIKNRCIACCFGVSLLPVAILTLGLGISVTSVSNIPESEFEKFCEEDGTDEATTTQEEYRNKARGIVVEVDD